jgi:L-seryl-tRNA(Ser) seleniumtransferase
MEKNAPGEGLPILRELPSIDELLRSAPLKEAALRYSASFVADAARSVLAGLRESIISGGAAGGGSFSVEELPAMVLEQVGSALRPGLRAVVNATGTILHTNMGRALLAEEAVEAIRVAAANPTNLELDLGDGTRGLRDSHVEVLIKRLTGAEAASVVNNNAAAVLIVLNTLAEGKEVIISRGELIEIGGSFRLPDIIAKSGCILKEVGTTNRTHAADYRGAVTDRTALILKAHMSNYRIEGFTAEVPLKELAAIGAEFGIPVVEDLGAGALVDLSVYGLAREPVVSERLAYGASVVTFSGDKLLGGPQSGIIAGLAPLVGLIDRNPLKRALRVDKLTLAALEATLRLYLNRDELARRLPTLSLMTRPVEELDAAAESAAALLKKSLGGAFTVEVEEGESVVGGGALPGCLLATRVVALTHPELSAEKIYKIFLEFDPPVIGRIRSDKFLLDMRTVRRPEDVAPQRGV